MENIKTLLKHNKNSIIASQIYFIPIPYPNLINKCYGLII